MSTERAAGHLLTLATLRLLTLNHDTRFSHVRSVPLSVLSELTARYLELLASTAGKFAEQSGRTTAAASDVVDAINEFGLKITEIQDWCEERRLGGDGVQMANSGPVAPSSLGALLKDTARQTGQQEPSQIIEYAPLTDEEELALAQVQQYPALYESAEQHLEAPSPSSSHMSGSPPPSYDEATAEDRKLVIKKEDVDPMAFLPPIPDLTVGQDSIQIIEEDESGRTVKRARRTAENMLGATGAWQRAIPFESSTIAAYQTRPPPDLDAAPSLAGALASQDIVSSSSLLYFLETFDYVSLDAQANSQDEEPLRPNIKRKRAATAIHSNILNPSDDSLSGAVPTPQPRHAKKQAGWIPYPPLVEAPTASEPNRKVELPFPPLHPFSTQLPPTITEPVPTIVLPHATRVLAPIMHPRYSTAHSSIRTLLEQSHTALFNRTTRLGPPGPLTENGAAGHYEIEVEKPVIAGWPGESAPRMLSWNFDWELGNEQDEVFKPSFANASGTITPAPGAGPSTSFGNADYAGPAFPQLPLRQVNNGSKTQHHSQPSTSDVNFTLTAKSSSGPGTNGFNHNDATDSADQTGIYELNQDFGFPAQTTDGLAQNGEIFDLPEGLNANSIHAQGAESADKSYTD